MGKRLSIWSTTLTGKTKNNCNPSARSSSTVLQQHTAFFDGAAQRGRCGCGFHIKISEKSHFSSFWHGGQGSNNLAEAMALTGLLKFCIFLGIPQVAIYGDSKLLIDSVNRKNVILTQHLSGWRGRINFYWSSMEQCCIHHIYRDKNSIADSLSKMGLSSAPGYWHLEIVSDDTTYQISDFVLPDF